MFTVRGRFDGKTIELLEPPPVDEETFVLVTFLEGPLETAAARESRRAVSVAMFSLDRYAGPLKQRLRAGQPSADAPRPFTVGEIMTRKVISVAPDATAAEAIHIMNKHGITSVLVEPDARGEWGIMTMRDVLQKIVAADRSPEEVAVNELASRPLVYVSPEMSLRDCSKLMIDRNIRRAAVRERDRIVGIISDTDIFQVVEERGWGPMPPTEA